MLCSDCLNEAWSRTGGWRGTIPLPLEHKRLVAASQTQYHYGMTIASIARKALARIVPSLNPDSYGTRLADKTPAVIFSTIYRKKLWGGRLTFGAHSGSGSRNRAVVVPYVNAVRKTLLSLGCPSVVDLGCGDFHVGSQLVDCSRQFIACDIVDFVIEQNRRRFPMVDFRVLDAINDDLPQTDVVLVRQVFQHLSNDQVSTILPKICRYQYAIITEHIPGFADFVPNQDKKAGPDHRVNFGSGLVLTDPPFNLTAKSSQTLCEVEEFGGVIKTILFERPKLSAAPISSPAI
jgi:hypothetical protein